LTLVLLLVTGFFGDDPDRNRIMLWMCVPIVASFASWMAVQTGKQVMRLVVWLMVLAVLFFVWLAAFSIGLYYVPVAALLLMAVLSPWEADPSNEA
jgi:presenilin-like A22 family membrane protease